MKYVLKKPLYPNNFMTEKTTSIEGITKEKPHKEMMYLINLLSLCRFSASAKGIANTQLIKAERKA